MFFIVSIENRGYPPQRYAYSSSKAFVETFQACNKDAQVKSMNQIKTYWDLFSKAKIRTYYSKRKKSARFIK